MTPSVQKPIGGKTCATDESELSMVHEGSSERIEQGNIMIDFIWVCIARSMVDLVTQRNMQARSSSMVQNTTLSMQRIARLNAVDITTLTGLDFRFSAPLSFRFVFETNDILVIRAVTSHGEALN